MALVLSTSAPACPPVPALVPIAIDRAPRPWTLLPIAMLCEDEDGGLARYDREAMLSLAAE